MNTLNSSEAARLKRIEQQLRQLAELLSDRVEALTLPEVLGKYARNADDFEVIMTASQTGKRLIVRHGRVVGLTD